MRNDLEALMRAVLACDAATDQTKEHARDILSRMAGMWTWGCIRHGVSPFPVEAER